MTALGLRKWSLLGNEVLVADSGWSPGIVAHLDKIFPQATIELGTSNEVLFASALPLELAERFRLQNSGGSLDAEASVIAVQYHNGRTAVAARFTRDVPNWIVKP